MIKYKIIKMDIMKWLSLTVNQSIKLIIAGVFFTLAVSVHANPLPAPPQEFFVSELMFDSSGNWTIKLGVTNFSIPSGSIDSVCISTSSGSAKLENFMLNYEEQQQIVILRKDGLDSDLVIHQEGDFVQVTTYYNGLDWLSYDTIAYAMIFGDYPEATVRSPKEGESIVFVPVNYGYYLSKNSNLYAIAKIDESGKSNVCTGEIRAIIHNLTDQPFPESIVQFNDEHYSSIFDMNQQTDNMFTGNVFACRYSFDKLYKWISPNDIYIYPISTRHDYWTIDPVQFEMEPDSVVLLDIYINGYVGIPTVKTEADVLKIYPNPIVGNSIYYETALPVKSTNSVIEITGLNGQRIGRYPVSENKGNISLPSNIHKGIYAVSLIVNQKNYITTKIIVP